MSNISDIYDAIRTRVATIFPNKRELSDHIIIDNNDELSLNDGYGIHFSTGVNTFRLVGCRFSIQREVSITLTKMIRGSHKDLTKIVEIEKALLEDQKSLVEDFSENEDIGAVVTKRNWVSDGGIERIFSAQKNFIMMEISFEIEYFENFA